MKIEEELEEERQKRGLTLEALARILDVSYSTLWEWTNTERRPGADNIEKIREWIDEK